MLGAGEPAHDAVRATYGGRPGHPVLLGRALLDRAGELRGDVGFRDLLEGAAGPAVRGRRSSPTRSTSTRRRSWRGYEARAVIRGAGPDRAVWEALIDLERVAPCLPGATITGHDEDGTYHGEFKVKLGPTTAAYRGTVKIEEADAADPHARR